MEPNDYTKERHCAKIGTREPALCGALPPGRDWKRAPTDGEAELLPACRKCEYLQALRGMWLAA